MSGSIKLSVTEGQSLGNGIRTVAGSIRVGELDGMVAVPGRDFAQKRGYQRPPTGSRINALARDLKAGTVDLPTAVLLNLRAFEPSWIEGIGPNLTLKVPASAKFFVVDGQHRIGAMEKLLAGEPENGWSDFQLHFVCMLGADELQEMRQFYVVNSTAKNVRTDLALDLLKQQAENDPDLMASLIDRGEAWKVNAQALAEKLGQDSPIWKDRIRFPGEAKGGSTITSSSMVSSLQGLMRHPYFGQLDTKNQAVVLDAYWNAIRTVIPRAFDDPADFAVQKGLGALVMHAVFPQVLEVVRSRHGSLADPDSFIEVISDALEELQDSTTDGEVVEGAMFWKKAPEGAAAQYSSSAGRRVLIARITHRLPEPEFD